MKFILPLLISLVLVSACQQKKKEKKDTSNNFPVRSYLQSQVKQLDTSLFRFTKIETGEKGSDTVIINRSEVRKYAADFLDIPDLKDPEEGSAYKASNIYDSALGMVVMSYLAEDDDVEVIRQEVQVIPTFGGNDEVKTIYIQKADQEGSTSIEKIMVWEVKKYFHIRTITQKKNEKEKIHDLKIIWQDFTVN